MFDQRLDLMKNKGYLCIDLYTGGEGNHPKSKDEYHTEILSSFD